MTRPVMELAGFIRVDLEPGESADVTFMAEPSQLAFLDREMKWKIEAGTIQAMIGTSSADIRYAAELTITEDRYIDGRMRRFYADARRKI